MSVLIDSNVLLRRAQPSHVAHTVSVQRVAKLLASGTQVCFTPQNITEFWAVATRPIENNGLGWPHETVMAEVSMIEQLLTLLPDSPAIFPEWKRLVLRYKVSGVKSHDARLAAVAKVYRIKSILTFNSGDFARYEHLAVLNPCDV